MTQKTAVITGASSGLGLEAARSLAAQGWHVIAHGRDAARSKAAEAEIRAVAKGQVDMIRGDLALISDTARMADEISALAPHIHVLLNNAGGMRPTFVITPEGNESTFAGNHLGHFLLTKRLMTNLKAAATGQPHGTVRIINTTSDGANYCPGLTWDDLQLTKNWVSGNSYCMVKLCNILFTRELAKRYAGDGIVAHALHPGVIASNFTAHVIESTRAYMATLDAQTPAAAAKPLVWLASSEEAGKSSGLYWNKGVAEDPKPQALDDEAAARLWIESENLLAKAGV
jgi:NAD(P)-dependent dehydrogenase (short-subunit alcohol dehydrogenase family)